MALAVGVAMEKVPAVVLFSGGWESTACALIAARRHERVLLVFFDYGQPYLRQEQEACRRFAERRAQPLLEVQLSTMGRRGKVFVGRNETFLREAQRAAHELPCALYVGVRNPTPFDAYGDSNYWWVRSMRAELPARIEAPLIGWPKAVVRRLVERAGVADCVFSSEGWEYEK